MWENSNNFGSRRFQNKPSTPFEPAWKDGHFWWKKFEKVPIILFEDNGNFFEFFHQKSPSPRAGSNGVFGLSWNLLEPKLFKFSHKILHIYNGIQQKTQITSVLEGFRTNQTHHSNRLRRRTLLVKKLEKSNNIMETFSNFFIKRVRLPEPVRMVCLVCPKTF